MITTKRLLLRPVGKDDISDIVSMVTEKVSLWTSPIVWPYRDSDALEWINSVLEEKRIGIFLKDSEKLTGTTSIPTKNGDEAGFWINDAYEGNGYATEAAAAIIEYAFKNEGLDYLNSCVHRDNAASKRVHEKLGYKPIAEEERFWPNKNAMVPVIVYELKRNDWQFTMHGQQLLQELEEKLWNEQYRFDHDWMDKILADDFLEFGRSGRIYSRKECLDIPKQSINAVLPLSDFKVHQLNMDMALVTYTSTVTYNGETEYANRSSIWMKTSAGWRIKFHQGTPTKK